MDEVIKLLPCPFCGSEKVKLSDNENGLMFNVHCGECCARGPWERCAIDGKDAWNTRALDRIKDQSHGE